MKGALKRRGVLAVLALLAFATTQAHAEVLIRWDQDQIPSPQALGISTVVVPANRPIAVRRALEVGYRVLVEIEAAAAATFKAPRGVAGVIVKGALPAGARTRPSLPIADPKAPGASRVATAEAAGVTSTPVRIADDRGKWPHIRTNWVTLNKDVLQVTNRSSQPWLENNEALIRIAAERAPAGAPPVLITYAWQPVTVADLDQGPRLEHYLVAIAEAGSFGADLLLPLHERFEKALLAARPDARADWEEMRRFIDFYAWNAASAHRPIANVGVIAADPMRSFEILNLLARHNLPFATIEPAKVGPERLAGLDLLIVLDDLDDAARAQVRQFTADGGRVVERQEVPADPNTFALEMRRRLGAERRVVDIWNGITVLVAPFSAPAGNGLLLTALNYAAQPLPVQVRVRGTFSEIQLDTPGQPPVLLPFEHRDGGTEFVLPALRIGARLFLTRVP